MELLIMPVFFHQAQSKLYVVSSYEMRGFDG